MRHQFGHLVLPVEDNSSTQIVFSTWTHQVSTALQLGNANMIHNIPLGNRCKSRLQGDVQIDSTQREVEKYLALRLQPAISHGSNPEAGESDTESDGESTPDEECAG